MTPIGSLWLPILLSAVIVFLLSNVLHMVLPYHRSDYKKVPKEDDVMAAMRPFDIPAGDYMMPGPDSMAAMRDPAFLERRRKGPVAVMTVMPGGPMSMGSNLAQWFVYSIVVSFFSAYVGSRALAPGADYLAVFRFVGSTAFLSYAMALPQFSIWYRRSWSTTLKSMFDGLLYGLFTAGTFGWLWPR